MKRIVYGKSKNGQKTKTVYLVRVTDQHGDSELVEFQSQQKAAWYYANCADAHIVYRKTYEVKTGLITNLVRMASLMRPSLFEEAVYAEGDKSSSNGTNPWTVPVSKAEKSQL